MARRDFWRAVNCLAGILLFLPGCSYQDPETRLLQEVNQLRSDLMACQKVKDSEEYLLESTVLSISNPGQTAVANAYHGMAALASCQRDADQLTGRVGVRYWCRRSR